MCLQSSRHLLSHKFPPTTNLHNDQLDVASVVQGNISAAERCSATNQLRVVGLPIQKSQSGRGYTESHINYNFSQQKYFNIALKPKVTAFY